MINMVGAGHTQQYNHCPMPTHACICSNGISQLASQRFCPSYTSLSPTTEVARPSLTLIMVSFDFQNSVSPKALGSPELAATGYTGIAPHTLYPFMLVGGSGHRGCPI